MGWKIYDRYIKMSRFSKSDFLLRHSQGICQTKFEDTKGVIRIRKSNKDKQHNGQKKQGQNDK